MSCLAHIVSVQARQLACGLTSSLVFGCLLLQSRYGLPHYAYLTRRTSHFLYAYHIRLSPYARFVRTTSLPYLYRSLSVTFVLHMVPSLLRIRYYPLFTNAYVPLYLQVYKPMYLDVEP